MSGSVANVGPNNVSPTRTPTTQTVQTNRYNTSSLVTIVSTNGANNLSLRTLDLTTSITQITKNGVALTNSGDELFSSYFVLGTPTVSSNNLNTNLFLPTQNYKLLIML